MRQPWRLLLLRTGARSPHPISTHSSLSQLGSSSKGHTFRSLSSLLHTQSLSPSPPYFNPPNLTNPINPRNQIARNFSSETAPEQPVSEQPSSDEAVVADLFAKFSDPDEIKKNLESSKIEITHDLVLKVLRNLLSNPSVAQGFFNWVASSDEKKLSSKSYNWMLQILGTNGLVVEFWGLLVAMKGLGYGMSRGVHKRVLKKFEEDGLVSEIEKLKEVFGSRPVDDPEEGTFESRVCRIIRKQLWGEQVEGQIRDLNVTFSSNSVKMVLENLYSVPMKALMYFRWLEESGLFKHDEQTYNVMARVLGRGDCIDRFWKLVDDMNGAGYEMETETFSKVFVRFCIRKRIEDAVGLFEFAMSGANKPSVSCCTILLKKIVVSKNLDIDLFSRVVKAFVAGGHKLSDSTLKAVLKSVTSVDRHEECNAILRAMEDGGYVMGGNLQRRVAFQLGRAGKKEEASEFMDNVEASGKADYRLQISLIEGYCKADELEKAADCLQNMVEKEGGSAVTRAVNLLVNAYCRKNRAVDAFNLLCSLITEKQLKPWHATYKVLISQLLVQGGFNNAINLFGLMKGDGFPPYVDPVIGYVSKSGSSDDAIALLKAMTSKKYPSKTVYLRLFEAFLKDGKRSKAQDFLSKCPGFIKNNADVLNLLCSTKSAKAAGPAPLAA